MTEGYGAFSVKRMKLAGLIYARRRLAWDLFNPPCHDIAAVYKEMKERSEID
jgi:hypothetical protein